MKALKVLKQYKGKLQALAVSAGVDTQDIDEAIAELELLKCCQNCKHYSMFEGKWECKNCYAKDYTNWEVKE